MLPGLPGFFAGRNVHQSILLANCNSNLRFPKTSLSAGLSFHVIQSHKKNHRLFVTLWLWLTLRHGFSMVHRNRWFTVIKHGWIFHGYVSRNQRVYNHW
jgi:hypothetical protein